MLSRFLERLGLLLLAVCCTMFMTQPAEAQDRRRGDEPPPNSIDQRTGEALNEAIEFLNMDQYDQAREVLSDLNFERLSPYERGRVEQILATLDYSQGDYPGSRAHMQAALDSGGLNEMEVSQVSYQIAQMFMAEENWVEGVRAMEAWLVRASAPDSVAAPNSAAYYLLAAAYYQLEQYDESLPHASKAVELSDTPQETWLQLLQALLLQKEDYRGAEAVLRRTINLYPDKKVYWMQLSSVYATLEDYPNALAVLELADHAGLLTEAADVRRLADLYMVQSSPFRAGTLLEKHIDSGLLEPDARLYESLANSWVAAREYRKSLPVLEQAAQLSEDGDLFVRLGEVNMQLEEWESAAAAFRQALDKGEVRDESNVHLLLGISLYNQDELEEARRWLEEASSSETRERTARGYLQLIESRDD